MPKHRRQNRRSHRCQLTAVAVMLVLAVFSAATARLFIWPDLEPIPRHVDAIIDLGGAASDRRELLARELAREHRPIFLCSRRREARQWRRCHPAVPGVTIRCFHADPNSTRGEAQYIAAEAARLGWRSVILVTTPDQAWRARLRTMRCFPGDVYVATAELPPESWIFLIPYQWAATVKALTVERSC